MKMMMQVKTLVLAGMIAAVLCAATPGAELDRALDNRVKAELERLLDQTIKEAAEQTAKKLNGSDLEGVNNIAILPLWGDCPQQTKDYLIRTLQSSIVGGRYRIMERNTQAWDNLLSEMEWNVLREDTMNQATLQRFGWIEGCDAVMYGTLRECATYPYPNRAYAVTRLSLTLGIVKTGQARWSSGEVVSVRLIPPPDKPPHMDPAVVRAINQGAMKAADKLGGSGAPLTGFCVFPLLGQDPNGYITGVLQGHLGSVGCSLRPVGPDKWQEHLIKISGDARSAESMRSFARENGYKAFLYGTVNECQIQPRKYKGVARMTVSLVDAETGQTLWSPGEIMGTAWMDWQDAVRLAVGDPIVWVLGGLLILIVFWRILRGIIRSATRPR